MPSDYLLRQLTDLPHTILYRGRENGVRRGTNAVPPLFGLDVSPLGQAVPWKLLALSSLVKSPPKRAAKWASGARLWGPRKGGTGLTEAERT